MTKKAPKAPGVAETAAQTAQANQNAAESTLRLNSLDQTGPFGSATFQRDASGLPTGQSVNLSQGLEQTSQNLQGSAANLSGFLPQDRFRLSDVPDARNIGETFFNNQQQLLEQPFQNQISDFEVRAAERGLPVGSEAFNRGLDPIVRNQNLALGGAAAAAQQFAGPEQQRLIGNQLLERGQGGVDAGQALGLLNQIPTPGFAPQPQAGVAAPDIQGLTQQNFQNRQSNAQQGNAALGSLLGAGATLLTGGLGAPLFAGAAGGLGGMIGGGRSTGFNPGEFNR